MSAFDLFVGMLMIVICAEFEKGNKGLAALFSFLLIMCWWLS